MSIQTISGMPGSSPGAGGKGVAERLPPSVAATAALNGAAPTATPGEAKADPAKVKEAAAAINSQLREMAKNIRFSVDDDTGETIVRVVDADTGQTLRQIPSEETLRIQHSLDKLRGVLLQHEA